MGTKPIRSPLRRIMADHSAIVSVFSIISTSAAGFRAMDQGISKGVRLMERLKFYIFVPEFHPPT